ncbi:hypothetical protein C8R46DRAFT_892581 [Mycena filopes]|nr:hypothetical protein C8R46DRAFT_892581 [Mycena filopes]
MVPPISQTTRGHVSRPAVPTPTTLEASLGLVACPGDAPPWFVNARGEMTTVDLGPHFDALLAAWTRIEYASRFEHGPTNLSAKGRPKQVGCWVADGRKKRPRTDVSIPDPAAYAVDWQAWWDSLQPGWRKKDAGGEWLAEAYGEGGAEWGKLYQWGVNGTLNVVASLYFWGCAIREQESDGKWESAMIDVTWMMEGMALYYEKFKRRGF